MDEAAAGAGTTRARLLARLADVPAQDWDALFPADYPFTRHAFLSALERHGCVTPRAGWQPCHLVLDDDAGRPRAAMPLYRKGHSYGEFVFDFGWAHAAQQLGLRYYPKLVCAVPFTPVTGPRFGARSEAERAELVQVARLAWEDAELSSVHALFLAPQDAAACADDGWLERNDVQFHWERRGAASFEEFLASLSHDKRKKILRERRQVREAGITFEWKSGEELDEAAWAHVYAMYGNTYDERGQAPYLTLDFFLDYARRPGTPVQLVLAYDGGAQPIAVAITLVGGDTLYGRHWGCLERYKGLHFETCYYQGIELCFAKGLSKFDAGAQGPHKLARGFTPVVTRSAHRLKDRRLGAAVEAFLARERAEVAHEREALASHSPYRRDVAGQVDHG